MRDWASDRCEKLYDTYACTTRSRHARAHERLLTAAREQQLTKRANMAGGVSRNYEVGASAAHAVHVINAGPKQSHILILPLIRLSCSKIGCTTLEDPDGRTAWVAS